MESYGEVQHVQSETRSNETVTIGILAFMGLLIIYVETMLTPALPVLQRYFDTNYDLLSWVLTAYIISGTVSAALFGKLADVVGKKKVILSLSLIYAASVSAGGFVATLGELIAVRAVQGIGFGMIPVAFAILNDQIPKERLALAQGIVSSTFAGGSAIGLVGGAWITQNFGWEWSYHSAIPLAVGLVLFIALFLKDISRPKKEKIDVLGITSLALGLTMLIFGLSEGQYKGWFSPLILGSFLVSILSFLSFVWAESNARNPFIDVNLLKIRNVFLANFTGLFALASLYFLLYAIPPLLQDPSPAGFGESIFTSGLILLPQAILTMIFAGVAAKVTTDHGPKTAILIGTTVLFLAFMGLMFNRATLLSISEDAAIVGIGLSFIFVGVINILLLSIPREKSGEATGMNVVFRNIGMSVAPAIGGVLETTYTSSVIVGYVPVRFGPFPFVPIMASFPATQAYELIFLVGITFLAAAIAFSIMMKNIIVKRRN